MFRSLATVLILFSASLTTPVSAGEEGVKAEDVVPYLIGNWRFELGERTGVRIYTPLFEDNSAQIEEYFDQLPVLGKGIVQYSAKDGGFSNALFFNVGENDFVTGVFSQEIQTITYRSTKPGNENLEFIFHIIGPDHFEFNNYRTKNDKRERILHVDFHRVK